MPSIIKICLYFGIQTDSEAFAFGCLTLVFTMRTALKVGIPIGLASKAKFDINLADITSASCSYSLFWQMTLSMWFWVKMRPLKHHTSLRKLNRTHLDYEITKKGRFKFFSSSCPAAPPLPYTVLWHFLVYPLLFSIMMVSQK
jgi:hypothetical protein